MQRYASPVTNGLDTAQMAAWRAFLVAHSMVSKVLEAELLLRHGMPLATYDVLVQLSETPEHRLRMSELADAVVLSRSGLTRLIDRLERERLVRRESCPSDLRGTMAVLTEEGWSALRAAAPTHLEGVIEHFTALLEPAELAVLAQALGRVAAAAHPAASRVVAAECTQVTDVAATAQLS